MQYRQVGATGKKASIIGLGCEHLDGKEYPQVKDTVDAALAGGVNLLDVFMPGAEIRANIRKALGSRRGDVMIQGHFGSTDVKEQYDISRDIPTATRYFEDLLHTFDGYIDFGMLFFIDSAEAYASVFETPFVDYLLKQKAMGKVGHIGFSSHNPDIAARVVETGVVEMMLFSINLAFDMHPAERNVLAALDSGLAAGMETGVNPKRAALYRLCEQRGVGITVMKPYGAGKLLSEQHTPFSVPMTTSQCIHYALTRPAVASVLPGCSSSLEMNAALSYLDESPKQHDYASVLKGAGRDFRGSCVYCNHCLPCPSQIDIAAVNKYLDIARLDEKNIPPSIRGHYSALSHHGEECVECGSCEERCPFGVSVVENMRQAARIFR